jgi:peptidoglycan/xylan/chitin deacetylase (PgdA/CDA1 family)
MLDQLYRSGNKKIRLSFLYLFSSDLAFFFLGVILTSLVAFFFIRNILNLKDSDRYLGKKDYYDEKVFQLPEDVVKSEKYQSATGEAKITIPIIMYHYVEYIKDPKDINRIKLTISPTTFESQLNFLRQFGYQTYFARDIPDIIGGKIVYDPSRSIVLTFDDGYDDFYTVVYPLLKKYRIRATVYVITDFVGRKGFLTNKQIVEMSKSNLIEIGAHTLDHLCLKSIDPKSAEKQIIGSKAYLEKLIGMDVVSFAYPYGAFNVKTIETVKKSGFTSATSVIPGVIQGDSNLFYLSRLRTGYLSQKNISEGFKGINK